MQLFRSILHARARRAHGYGTPPEDAERAALAIYLLSSLLASVMSVFGKLCSAAGVHFFTLVAARSGVLCLLIVPLLVKHRVNPFVINEAFPLLLLRGFFGFTSLSLWYLSMSLLPLSDANALSFVSPVCVALLAPMVLGERTPRAVYVSLPACLAGMLMVAQPTWLFGSAAGQTSTLGVLAGILQALLSSGSKLTIRALNKHQEPLESILFSMGFISTVGAAIGSLLLPGIQFAPPQAAAGWAYLAATSLIALVVQAMFTASVRKINAAKAASLDYLSLLYTLLADGLVFHKLPNRLSLAGAGIITAASLGSLLWTVRAPAGACDAAGAAAAARAAARPQQYKREYYLGAGAGSGQHKRAPSAAATLCDGGGSSSEDEAVSLIRAVAAGAGWTDAEAELSATSKATPVAGLAGQQDAGHVVGPAAIGIADASAAHVAAKLALVSCLTDSSKSWRLGTELEAAATADAAAEGFQKGSSAGMDCDSTPAAARSGNSGVRLELQAVVAATAPAAMRTSTEKEQALAAAGK